MECERERDGKQMVLVISVKVAGVADATLVVHTAYVAGDVRRKNKACVCMLLNECRHAA